MSPDAIEYVIRDEGDGFDHANLPDPTDAENLFKLNGRGVMLMRLSMDEVRFNDSGTEVTMIRRARPESPESAEGQA